MATDPPRGATPGVHNGGDAIGDNAAVAIETNGAATNAAPLTLDRIIAAAALLRGAIQVCSECGAEPSHVLITARLTAWLCPACVLDAAAAQEP